MNLKPDTFKVWEPKIIGIVLNFPVEWSSERDRPLCRTKESCVFPFAYEQEGKDKKGEEKRRRRKRRRKDNHQGKQTNEGKRKPRPSSRSQVGRCEGQKAVMPACKAPQRGGFPGPRSPGSPEFSPGLHQCHNAKSILSGVEKKSFQW